MRGKRFAVRNRPLFAGGAGLEHRFGSQRPKDGRGGIAGAAGAEDERLFAGDRNAGSFDQGLQSAEIGVVAAEFAAAVDDGIDGADGFGGFVYLIQIGDDRLLIGDGDIDPLKFPALQKGANLLRRKLLQFVWIVADPPVDFRGKTVGKMLPDESVLHGQPPNQSVP